MTADNRSSLESRNSPSREGEKNKLKHLGVPETGIDGWAANFVGPLRRVFKANVLRAGKPAGMSDILTHPLF